MLLALAVGASAEEAIRFCIDHHPPNHMFPEEMDARWQMQKGPFGPAILQVEELAERLGLKLELTPNTPFNRCLALMREGQVDLMWGLQDVDDRSRYMHLIPFRPSTHKGFYIRKGSNLHIEKFQDLKGLRVGTALGFRYYPEFDQATDLFIRIEANSNEKLFQMLARDCVDTIVMTEYQAEDLLQRRPDLAEVIVKAPYRAVSESQSHIALSKRSRYAARLSEFQQATQDMVQEDRFSKIREAFNEWYQIQLDASH